jgi:hypothetical protein
MCIEIFLHNDRDTCCWQEKEGGDAQLSSFFSFLSKYFPLRFLRKKRIRPLTQILCLSSLTLCSFIQMFSDRRTKATTIHYFSKQVVDKEEEKKRSLERFVGEGNFFIAICCVVDFANGRIGI